MDCSLNSSKGGYIGEYIGAYYRGYSGDTRSLDSGSHGWGMFLGVSSGHVEVARRLHKRGFSKRCI